jgi:hypothetical protein
MRRRLKLQIRQEPPEIGSSHADVIPFAACAI